MTILIIEDSRFMQLALDKAIRAAGYRTRIVSEGEAGVRSAIQNSPDLILLDIMLPGLPGTSVLRSLKHKPVTSRIPVIVLTGMTRLDETSLKNEGAAAYLAKADLNVGQGCPALLRLIQQMPKKDSNVPALKCV